MWPSLIPSPETNLGMRLVCVYTYILTTHDSDSVIVEDMFQFFTHTHTHTHTQVICRQLGYMGGVVSPYLQFGEGGPGPTWLDSLQCSGNESNITECEGAEFRDYHCNHFSDVGVVCQGK